MTNKEFKEWQKRMGLNNNQAAIKLGVSLSSVEKYRNAQYIPKPIEKLCFMMEES